MDVVATDTTATLTASAISVYIIQKLKSANWFKLLGPNTKYMNIAASLFTAAISATGINFAFNESAGTLTITGLTLTGILTALWTWGKSFVLNEMIYQGTIGGPQKSANAAQTAIEARLYSQQAQKVGPQNPQGEAKPKD